MHQSLRDQRAIFFAPLDGYQHAVMILHAPYKQHQTALNHVPQDLDGPDSAQSYWALGMIQANLSK